MAVESERAAMPSRNGRGRRRAVLAGGARLPVWDAGGELLLVGALVASVVAAACSYQRVAPLHTYPAIPPDVAATERAAAPAVDTTAGLAGPPAGETRSEWLAAWLQGPAGVVATAEERREYLGLGDDAERERFVREFWRRRAVAGEEESFLREFARRVGLADRLFGRPGIEGWRTVFGHVLLALGEPERVEIVPPQLTLPGDKVTPASRPLAPGAPAAEGVAVIWHYGSRLRLPTGERIPTLPYILGAVPFTFYGGFWRMACSPAYDATTRLGAIQDEPIMLEHTRTLAAEGTFSRRIRSWHDVETCPAYDRRFLQQAARATLRGDHAARVAGGSQSRAPGR